MNTKEIGPVLVALVSELIDGAAADGAFVLNSGDVGLLRSLDKIPAADASRAVNDGATIAAHLAYHLGAIGQIDKSARGPKEGTF